MNSLFSADLIYGTGLREERPRPTAQPSQWRACPGLCHRQSGRQPRFHRRRLEGRDGRVDIINVFDVNYQIRSGSGVGVFAPQYGARRGFFVGLSKAL